MNSFITFQCGLSCGGVRVSSPLAMTSADSYFLILKAPFLHYSFRPNQVINIEAISTYRLRIIHTIDNYPENIEIKLQRQSEQVLKDIYECGFTPSAVYNNEITYSRKDIPIRSSIIILLLLIWYFTVWATPRYPELSILAPLPVITLLVISFSAIIILRSSNLQKFILKPNRKLGEIKPVLYLVAVLSGLTSIIMMLSVLFVPKHFSKNPQKCPPLLEQRVWWCLKNKNSL